MLGFNVAKVWPGSVFVLLTSLGIFARAALGGDLYTPAPPVAVPLQAEHERHGLLIAAQHPRTQLVDGSGLALWNNPSCASAPVFGDRQLGRDRYAVIDPPTWLHAPVRSDAWLAVGIVSGMHIHFEAPVSKTARVREIAQADPSVAFGFYCVYEEFYRTPGDPAAGGEAYWSRIEVDSPYPAPNYFARPGYPVVPRPHGQPPIHADNSGWPTPAPTATPRFVGSPSFFPPRPPNAEIRYRTGVLIGFGAGNKAGSATIKDVSGRTHAYFWGWPIFIDGKQTRCAFPPLPGIRFDSTLCSGGWPADIIIGTTRVRVYYWHDVTPWGQHVEVTDQIIKAP
jgi:hypothetical protein